MYFCKEAKELFADVCVIITWTDNIVTDENLGDEPMMKLQDTLYEGSICFWFRHSTIWLNEKL